MNLETIRNYTGYFTDKGASQVATHQNAAMAQSDPANALAKKFNYAFGRDKDGRLLESPESTGDFIAIGYFKKGADILWHETSVLVDSDAEDFTCEVGLMDAKGNFTLKATISSPTNFVGTAVIPEPFQPILEEASWVVARITGDPPQTGKASFYVHYIALA